MALAKERVATPRSPDALGDLFQVHACREMIEALPGEDHRSDVVISKDVGELLLELVDVLEAHEVPRRAIDAEGRNMVGHGVQVRVSHSEVLVVVAPRR